MTDEIRQDGKTVLKSEDGLIPMFFNNLYGKNLSGNEYRNYIKYIALGEMGFKPGHIEFYRTGMAKDGRNPEALNRSPKKSTKRRTKLNDLQIWKQLLFTRRKPISATSKTLRHYM